MPCSLVMYYRNCSALSVIIVIIGAVIDSSNYLFHPCITYYNYIDC